MLVTLSKQHFDAVILHGVLEHLSDVSLAMIEVVRVLKPDGYVFEICNFVKL